MSAYTCVCMYILLHEFLSIKHRKGGREGERERERNSQISNLTMILMTSLRHQGIAQPHYILISSDSVFMACDRSIVMRALQRHGKLRESDAVRSPFCSLLAFAFKRYHCWLLLSNAIIAGYCFQTLSLLAIAFKRYHCWLMLSNAILLPTYLCWRVLMYMTYICIYMYVYVYVYVYMCSVMYACIHVYFYSLSCGKLNAPRLSSKFSSDPPY